MRDRNRSCISMVAIFAFFLLLILLGAWFTIPYMAEKHFGEPVASLTGFDRWNFSRQVLAGRTDLLSSVSNDDNEQKFTISSGESVSSVAVRLEEAGLINNASAFRAYLVYKGLDSSIKAGKFKLSASQTSLEIIDAIQSVYSAVVPFYVYPGWRAEEIAAALPTSGIEVSPEDFLSIVHHPKKLTGRTEFSEFPSLDGFLFPGEYEIDRKISAEGLVLIFLERFSQQVPTETINRINTQGLSLYEGITLASIIQRETFMDEERALMASVFYNRLRDGMRLETDPTVQYALGYSNKWGNWWKTPLRAVDLQVDSPYNTYIIYGLPPTPIANPDLPSIEAVANPEATGYYYFRAMCDNSGYHDFSVTFEEHTSKGCQ